MEQIDVRRTALCGILRCAWTYDVLVVRCFVWLSVTGLEERSIPLRSRARRGNRCRGRRRKGRG